MSSQMTPLGQEDDCGGRANPKGTLKRNETIVGFFNAASVLGRGGGWLGEGLESKTQSNQRGILTDPAATASFKSTAPLIYRLGGLFRVT